ncbi:thrombospondin type-1 domain-containing protein 4-like [Centruroides vittatus]|uniref:thrombospondin type-1 domain-containing protein 4-like n=1 Tax=Centruroides vittatus TaxID=120091 RepID=UPI00350EEBFA
MKTNFILLAVSLNLMKIPEFIFAQMQRKPKENTYFGEKLEYGSWSSWSNWSPCSRTCGRGISSQIRNCLSEKTTEVNYLQKSQLRRKKCFGIKKRYVVCQEKDCPDPKDYRAQQCSYFDTKIYQDQYYKWIPYLKTPEDCQLNCRPTNKNFFVTFLNKVEDGTSCSGNNFEDKICVDGQCKAAGCDGVVGSNKKLDQCGVCGGDNSTCRIVSGLYTRPTLPIGYNLIAKIPAGACNVNITELKKSNNYLALRTQSGKYVINGNWAINWSGTYEAASTRFVYRRHDGPSRNGEQIVAKGPTSETVDVLIIYQQPNHGIKYEYSLSVTSAATSRYHNWNGVKTASLPLKETDSGYSTTTLENQHEESKKDKRKQRHRNRNIQRVLNSDRNNQTSSDNLGQRERSRYRQRGEYRWRIMGFTECTTTCGGGIQKALVVCVKRKLLSVVEDKKCDGMIKPAVQTVRCNSRPCPARWTADAWSSCSTSCGEGIQTRIVTCKQDLSPRLQIKVDESDCLASEKPQSSQPCNLNPCNQWTVGDWTQCSVDCGRGIKKRDVKCISSHGSTLPDSECSIRKPEVEETCEMKKCISNTWFFSEWSKTCSVECGTGVQTRIVMCPTLNSTKNIECHPKSKPPSEKSCTKICGAKWFTGPWSQCSGKCGHGIETRDVVCLLHVNGQWKETYEKDCHGKKKPPKEQSCHLKPCGPQWFTNEWSQCSKTCGRGIQTREVICSDSTHRENDRCNLQEKPQSTQSCNNEICSKKDADCIDKYLNCQLVVRARLCSYSYYRQLCCESCREVT